MRGGWFALMLPIAVSLVAEARATEPPLVPLFVDETVSSGLDSVFTGEWEFMVGGGAAAFDCDDDGRPDLLLAGGTSPARLYRNESETGGSLRFVAQQSGLEAEGVSGAWPLDVDGDGIMDVALTRVGENVLMRGLGGCRFERANEAWGFDGGDAWSTAFAATWERDEAWPTLAIGNYVDREQEAFPWGACTDNWLHRPAVGRAGFAPPLPLKPSHCALSILFTDWNRSGTLALRVSNDREYYKGGQEQLWRVEPGQAPTLYTVEDGWKALKVWGMGIAAADLDFDGFPEFFLTSMADNKLQALAAPGAEPPRPDYVDIAFKRGVTAHRPYTGGEVKPSTAWHAEFQDVNNDGRLDLLVVKGNVWEMPDFARLDPNNLLLQAGDGRFHEAGDTAGVASMRTGRGGALADFNLDGYVDLVVVNRGDPAQLWRNTGNAGGNWAQIRLLQPRPNVNAVGAWVGVRRGSKTEWREITVGGGHGGGQAGWIHIGLGAETEAALTVVWPDGTAEAFGAIEAGRFHILERGQEPRPWTAR